MNALRAVIQTIRHLKKQERFLHKQIEPILSEARRSNDGSLAEKDFAKINRYYGLAVPAILGEAFAALHKRSLSAAERACLTAQGAMTGLFDDFFDDRYLSDQSIEGILNQQQAETVKSTEALFLLFFREALEKAPDASYLRKRLNEVHRAQSDSRLQTISSTNLADIQRITFDKGGFSLLFYRTAVRPPETTAEAQWLFGLGAMMQLSNDVFDVYKDREAGVRTLVTEATHINDIRSLFCATLQSLFQQKSIVQPTAATRSFLSLITLGIFARTLVCLDQLEALQIKTGQRFTVQAYSRQQLICDMDTWANKLKSLRYYQKLMQYSA